MAGQQVRSQRERKLAAMRGAWEALGNTNWDRLYWVEYPFTQADHDKHMKQLEKVVDAVQEAMTE